MTDVVVSAGDAILAKARAAVDGVTVFDAHVPSSTAAEPLPRRYAVVYPSTPERTWQDLGHTSDTYRVEWQVTSVGATRPEAEWVATRIRDGLVDERLTITGLVCDPVEHLAAQPIRWDDQVPGRVVIYGTDQYGFDATADTDA